MKLGKWLFCIISALCAVPAAAQQSTDKFTYHSPGIMTHADDKGVTWRDVYFPTMKFPILVGPIAGKKNTPLHAYANSQVWLPAHFSINDPRSYAYPWIDTLCESKHKGGPMPLCPKSPRHQGVDIRPDAPVNKKYAVLAWTDGIVTHVNGSGTSEVNIRYNGNNSGECVYLHLKPLFSLKINQTVKQGDRIGVVSNRMKGGTSIHLHIQCKMTVPKLRAKANMPIYTSLIAAYRREWGLPDLVENGVLKPDPQRELDDTLTTDRH
jgi:hypothetical protein